MTRRKSPRAKPKKKRRGAPSPSDAKGATKGVPIPKSGRSGIYWPAMPIYTDALVLAFQCQFEQSQWWPAETLLQHQLRQLEFLLAHAARTVPLYRDRLGVLAGTRSGELTMAAFHRLPLLSRTDIQEAGAALVSRRLPKDHGGTSDISTSGSTGRPVTVKATAITGLFFRALSLRYHLWHGRDFAAKTAKIHRLKNPALAEKTTPWVPGYATGLMVHFDIIKPVKEQIAWLEGQKPAYLLTHPTNLHAIIMSCERSGTRIPGLREIATLGEVVNPEVRADCQRVLGVPIVDLYSSQEVGLIALQCPDRLHYHVQSENVLVEILDGDGNPCEPGDVGRIVVTDLHNFASPLIRYEIGDYGEFGGPCPCGRGLPVITRILGRARNFLTLPSGEKLWPVFEDVFAKGLGRAIPSLRQAQLIQRTREEIEVLLVVSRPPTAKHEARARQALGKALSEAFTFTFVYVDEIPLSSSYKFEAVLSVLGDSG